MSTAHDNSLALRHRAGDRRATALLVESCRSSVVAIARQYRRWGAPLDDLIQEGFLGLFKAIDRFDPNRNVRLTTYARYWIRAELREYVIRQYRMVRVGTTKGDRRALRLFRRTREQRPEVLASLAGIATERAAALLPLLLATDASLDAPVGGDGPALQSRIAHQAPNAEDLVAAASEERRLAEIIARAIAELDPRLRAIVERRLMPEEPATLGQLGAAFGVSKERVRQLELEAKRRLRRALSERGGCIVDARTPVDVEFYAPRVKREPIVPTPTSRSRTGRRVEMVSVAPPTSPNPPVDEDPADLGAHLLFFEK